jgi:hypothetical protein
MTDNFMVFYIVFGTIALIISFFLIRWVLGIDRQIKNQKAMIALLIMMCRKQGITDDDLQKVRNAYEVNEP